MIKVLTDLVFGESPLPGLQMATLLLCLHMVARGSTCVSSFSYKGKPIMTSSKHNYLPKSPSLNTTTLGVRKSTYGFGGNTNIQSIAHSE